jgi:hypothetical protein
MAYFNENHLSLKEILTDNTSKSVAQAQGIFISW